MRAHPPRGPSDTHTGPSHWVARAPTLGVWLPSLRDPPTVPGAGWAVPAPSDPREPKSRPPCQQSLPAQGLRSRDRYPWRALLRHICFPWEGIYTPVAGKDWDLQPYTTGPGQRSHGRKNQPTAQRPGRKKQNYPSSWRDATQFSTWANLESLWRSYQNSCGFSKVTGYRSTVLTNASNKEFRTREVLYVT